MPVAARRFKTAARAKCPAWQLQREGGGAWVEQLEARPLAAQAARSGLDYLAARGAKVELPSFGVRGFGAQVAAPKVLPRRAAGPRRLVAAWRSHVEITGAGLKACLACGCSNVRKRGPRDSPCPRFGALAPIVRNALAAGAFDDCIRGGGALLKGFAAARGRQLGLSPSGPCGPSLREPD